MFSKSRAVKVLAGMGVGAALVLLFENSASSQGFGFRPGPGLQRPQTGPLNNGSLQPGFVFGFQPTPNPMFSGGSNNGNGGGNNGGGGGNFGGGGGGLGGGGLGGGGFGGGGQGGGGGGGGGGGTSL